MKSKTLFSLAAGAALLAAAAVTSQVVAQDASADTDSDVISTINSIAANNAFNADVQRARTFRDRVQQQQAIISQLDPASDDYARALEIQEQAVANLNALNQAMVQTYGYSLNENYLLEVNVAHIYVEITAAEAQALAAQLSEEGN